MSILLSPLPLDNWHNTKTALHLFLQIVGKIRMSLHPKRNHWWHVTLYVTATGLTTGPIPYPDGLFQIDFDFLNHQLIIKTNENQSEQFSLANLSVANFYEQLTSKLNDLNIPVNINKNPFDPDRVKSNIPFPEDQEHVYTDLNSAQQFWRILSWIYPVFQSFGGQFNGKTTPAHLYWHSMDYVLTHFSGKNAPSVEGMDPVSAEAYSHEVISFGFWPGDDNLPEPAFYSYTYPAPDGLMDQALKPETAAWFEVNNSPMAILKYHDLINEKNPENLLLDFLQSAFDAGANLSNW